MYIYVHTYIVMLFISYAIYMLFTYEGKKNLTVSIRKEHAQMVKQNLISSSMIEI